MFKGYDYIYGDFNPSGIFYTVHCQWLEVFYSYDTCVTSALAAISYNFIVQQLAVTLELFTTTSGYILLCFTSKWYSYNQNIELGYDVKDVYEFWEYKVTCSYIDTMHRHMQYYFLHELYYNSRVYKHTVYKLLNLFSCVNV